VVYEYVKLEKAGSSTQTEAETVEQIENILAQHADRLRACLQQALGDSSGPEEGSDAWLLLNALTSEAAPDGTNSTTALITRLEQSGHALAEQGGKLEARLQGLQSYIDALTRECHLLFANSSHLASALERLYKLQSACILALSRGYQAVMDNVAQQRQQLEQHLGQRLQALQRINSISNSTMDLDQTLEITAKKVAEELQVDLCSIFFYDELQRLLTLRATNGPRPLGGMHYTLRLGEGYSGWVADKGTPLLVHDALADAHFSGEAGGYPQEYHGLMAVPIIFFGNVVRLIGVISVQSIEPRDFAGEEMNFVEVVAGIIAINSENGRLYEQTDEQLRRKVHELATIHRVSSIIASTLNLDEVLQIIGTQAVHLSGAERSCIFGLDGEKQQLHVLAHYGMNGTDVRRIHIPVGQCCAGRAVATGQPSSAIDCFQNNDEPCFLRDDPLISSEIHSVLCVPLKVKQKVLGCICIYSSHRHALSPEQMQLIVTFANEAAIAIDNARLYEETRRGLELKSALLRELHHRVKNNLATVAGILSLQRRRTKSSEVRNTLAESVNRVQGLAATHDLLSHEDVSEARVDDIARKIVGVANANLRPPETHITFEVEPCPIVIPSRAVAILGLVLNEMVSNAIKHGMTGIREGTVTIRGRKEDDMVIVEVIDNGRGPLVPDVGAQFIAPDTSLDFEGLGLSLIRNLIGDLGGHFVLRRDIQRGQTISEVRFPLVRRSVA
jgi:two-component sensor histidine kinase/putative methionine-R-sulfoxide reductase with GAF domain